jgi:hypothetical protein
MKSHRIALIELVVCVGFILFIALTAYAYIDPNAAGLLSQIITPLLVAAAAAFTFFRKQVGAAFAGVLRLFRRSTDA